MEKRRRDEECQTRYGRQLKSITDYNNKSSIHFTVFANVISCEEGIEAAFKSFPDIKIVTCFIDGGLNEDKFIMPGLGDYGDRFFNTV